MIIEQHGPAGSDRYTPGRTVAIDRIVLHTMVGWISQANATFKTGGRLVSAHYGVRVDGTIWQWVAETDTAWHAGNWPVNQRSIGIEHEDGGDYNGIRPELLYSASTALVRDICLRYGIPMTREYILRHNEVNATACPDALDTERIVNDTWKFGVLGKSRNLAVTSGDTNGEWAALYRALAPQAGIRAELAYAQAIKETGNFSFTGIARPEWNNPAGLGVWGAAGEGNRFPSKEAGVRAHLGHLLWYFGAVHPVVGFCDVDQRHFGAHKGLGDHIVYLDGRWAYPGTGYGESIVNIANTIIAPDSPPPPPSPFTAAQQAYLDAIYMRK